MSYVFADTKGKIVSRKFRGKGYVWYVGKTGKIKELLNPRRKQKVVTASFTTIFGNELKKGRNKTTAGKVVKSLQKLTFQEITLRGKLTLPKMAKRFSRSLGEALKLVRSRRMFQAEAVFIVELSDGELRTVDNRLIPFSASEFQKFSNADLEQIVEIKLHRVLASYLADKGLVTAGSAQHIQRLAINKGKPRDEWKQVRRRKVNGKWVKRVQPWEKWDYEVVKVRQFSFRISQIKL